MNEQAGLRGSVVQRLFARGAGAYPPRSKAEPRDSPATKSSGCLSAKREPRRVSTDRRSLPKAVARVVPQGAERSLEGCGFAAD